VVVDEFGSTAGVITVEDVLKQLVGEVQDEFDIAATQQPALAENVPLLLEGSVGIRELESQYGLELPRDAGFETLAGFVLARLQRIPQAGAAFAYENHRFTVAEMEAHRIAKIKIEEIPPAAMGKAGD